MPLIVIDRMLGGFSEPGGAALEMPMLSCDVDSAPLCRLSPRVLTLGDALRPPPPLPFRPGCQRGRDDGASAASRRAIRVQMSLWIGSRSHQ